jgi:hypothetical protein
MKFLAAVALALMVGFAPGGAEGQGPQRSRSITGTVLDPSGAAIVGAKVGLSRQGVVRSQTTTDNLGSFRFENLPAGTYQVDIRQEGFREARIEVTVGTRPVAPIRAVLGISVASQEVTVQAEAAAPRVTTDIAQNQNANTVDRAALDRVPVFDQDYVTTLSRFLDDSAMGTNGVSLVVNGVEANGPGVTASAVKEVRITRIPTRPFSPGPAVPGLKSSPRAERRSFTAP